MIDVKCMNNIKVAGMYDDYTLTILLKYFYSLAPIFVVSTKCIDPYVLNSWFQTLQTTINGKIIFRWILIFVV